MKITNRAGQLLRSGAAIENQKPGTNSNRRSMVAAEVALFFFDQR
jgi:hypothetical protein